MMLKFGSLAYHIKSIHQTDSFKNWIFYDGHDLFFWSCDFHIYFYSSDFIS